MNSGTKEGRIEALVDEEKASQAFSFFEKRNIWRIEAKTIVTVTKKLNTASIFEPIDERRESFAASEEPDKCSEGGLDLFSVVLDFRRQKKKGLRSSN